jgi:hypothetical protein
MDSITNLYTNMIFDQILLEMTTKINRNVSAFSPSEFNHYIKTLPHTHELSNGALMHSTSHLMNHLSSYAGQAVHMTSFARDNSKSILPFDYDHQGIVDQHESAPKGTARAVILKHLDLHKVPISSSDVQTEAGHKMWRKLVPDAIDKGYHVYYWDSEKLHKTDRSNMEAHLNSYFGDDPTKRMVISKEPIHGSN